MFCLFNFLPTCLFLIWDQFNFNISIPKWCIACLISSGETLEYHSFHFDLKNKILPSFQNNYMEFIIERIKEGTEPSTALTSLMNRVWTEQINILPVCAGWRLKLIYVLYWKQSKHRHYDIYHCDSYESVSKSSCSILTYRWISLYSKNYTDVSTNKFCTIVQ